MAAILYRSDFSNLIETLSSRKMGVSIKLKIDDWHREYESSNTKCLLQLLEEFDINFPQIVYRRNFFLEDLLFDEWEHDGYSQVEYAYSYIIHKLDGQSSSKALHPNMTDSVGAEMNLEESKPNRCFECILDSSQKELLFDKLVDVKVFSGYDKDDFLFMLSGKEVGDFSKKMIWEYEHKRGQANYRLIHQMLSKICPTEFDWQTKYYQKVCYFIARRDGEPFQESVIRSFNKQNSRGETARITDMEIVSKNAKPILAFIDDLIASGSSRVQGKNI